MKFCPVGAELFHSEGQLEGQTHTTELTSAFRNFDNAPKTNENMKHIFSRTEILLDTAVMCHTFNQFPSVAQTSRSITFPSEPKTCLRVTMRLSSGQSHILFLYHFFYEWMTCLAS